MTDLRTESEICESINRLLKEPKPERDWFGLLAGSLVRAWVILALCTALFVIAYFYLGRKQ